MNTFKTVIDGVKMKVALVGTGTRGVFYKAIIEADGSLSSTPTLIYLNRKTILDKRNRNDGPLEFILDEFTRALGEVIDHPALRLRRETKDELKEEIEKLRHHPELITLAMFAHNRIK